MAARLKLGWLKLSLISTYFVSPPPTPVCIMFTYKQDRILHTFCHYICDLNMTADIIHANAQELFRFHST